MSIATQEPMRRVEPGEYFTLDGRRFLAVSTESEAHCKECVAGQMVGRELCESLPQCFPDEDRPDYPYLFFMESPQ